MDLSLKSPSNSLLTQPWIEHVVSRCPSLIFLFFWEKWSHALPCDSDTLHNQTGLGVDTWLKPVGLTWVLVDDDPIRLLGKRVEALLKGDFSFMDPGRPNILDRCHTAAASGHQSTQLYFQEFSMTILNEGKKKWTTWGTVCLDICLPLFHGLRKKGAMTAMPSAPISAACRAFKRRKKTIMGLVTIPVSVGWGVVSPHQQAILRYQLHVLQFYSTLILSTWRPNQIAQVQGSVLQDYLLPWTLDASHKPRSSPVLLTDWLQTWRF